MTNALLIVSNACTLLARSSEHEDLDWKIAAVLAAIFIPLIIMSEIRDKRAVKRAIQDGDADFFNRRGCNAFPYSRGIDSFRRAIAFGSTDALFNLGVCYREGAGVKRDLARAYEFFRQAAEKGDPDAVFWCGALWEQRGGVDEALEWYRRGQTISYKCLLRLARFFDEGGATPVNPLYADVLREEAQKMKNNLGAELDKILERKLTTKDGERTFYYGDENRSKKVIREDFNPKEEETPGFWSRFLSMDKLD